MKPHHTPIKGVYRFVPLVLLCILCLFLTACFGDGNVSDTSVLEGITMNLDNPDLTAYKTAGGIGYGAVGGEYTEENGVFSMKRNSFCSLMQGRIPSRSTASRFPIPQRYRLSAR